MMLNRTQALFLVGTIAAVGCVVEDSDDDTTGDDNEAGAGGSSGSDTGGTSGTSGTSGSNTGGTTSGGGEGGGGGQGGAACMDEAGPQVMCETFTEPGAGGVGAGGEGYGGAGGVGPSCEGMADAQNLFCADLWTNFKPSVANAARTCMNAQTPEDICTWTYTHGCAAEAILAACPDDSATPECEAIMAGCPDLVLADCLSVLGAMTEVGRAAVVTCAAESLECNPWVCAGVASSAGE